MLLGDGNLFRVSSSGLEPMLLSGERLPSGASYSEPTGFPRVHLSSAGELYISVCGEGPHRIRAGSVETVLPGPELALDGRLARLACNAAVSPSGNFVVFDAWTGEPDTRLYVKGPEGVRSLAVIQGGPRDTVLPVGGRLVGWGHLAIDDLGRVMADLAFESGASSGLYLWENGEWTPTMLRGESRIRGGVLEGIYGALAAEDRFHAVLRAGCCEMTFGEYQSDSWRSLLEPEDARPAGGDIALGGAFDVNSRGDILFQLFGPFGQGLALRADGRTRLVVSESTLIDQGIIFEQFGRFDLRDDGSFYFQAIDVDDVITLYRAIPAGSPEPLEDGLPAPPRLRARALTGR